MGPQPSVAAHGATAASGSQASSHRVYQPILRHSAIVPMTTAGPTGMTPTQIRHAYGIDNIKFNGVTGDGTGTTIAIVDAYNDPNITNDLHQFDLAYGLADPPSFTVVSQTGSTTSLPSTDDGWATEIALDVEWSHAVAPGAKILLVEASSASHSDLDTAEDYARNYTNVVAVSNSWGGSEASSETGEDSHFTTPSGHTGVTFLVASGDSGAPAEYPESSPNVIAVGATSLTLTAQNTISSETVWNSGGGSSTGGLSAYESAPSYQSGLAIHNGSSTVSAGGKRATPDVAYDGDPNTGFGVYDSLNNGTTTPWDEWGGTSDAAPQWAGIIAIANQGRVAAGESFLDGASQVLPTLYSVEASGFNDITSGSSGGSPIYTAGTGFDLATGLGSPIANVLVADLVGQTTSATQFSVTTSSSTTAGATISSVTVSAETSSGAVATGYLGTVHFTSSDGQAVLPANYTFVAGDSGVHTFTATVLKTAASQTIKATDTSTSSITGSATVTVSPATASQLVFGQQPTSVVVGSAISPAVTVRAFGRLQQPLHEQ